MELQNRAMRDKEEEKGNKGKKVQRVQQQVQPANPAAASPPSSSSSPEFTFTISLHPTATKIPENKNKTTPPPPTVDLSPADEIFFHGHLLPLHLLSHHIPPISPRSSTNSIDNFTLPIKELSQQNHHTATGDHDAKTRKKSKSFSLLFGSKWSKQSSTDKEEEKRKSKFEVLKRYIRLVKPFIYSLRNRKIRNRGIVSQSYSCYSENLRLKSKKELRGKRGGFSAPASMWNSPTNSGRLVASGSLTPITATASTSDSSTMEELQAAIQAAIAHCKNSVASQDRMKMTSSTTTTTSF